MKVESSHRAMLSFPAPPGVHIETRWEDPTGGKEKGQGRQMVRIWSDSDSYPAVAIQQIKDLSAALAAALEEAQ